MVATLIFCATVFSFAFALTARSPQADPVSLEVIGGLHVDLSESNAVKGSVLVRNLQSSSALIQSVLVNMGCQATLENDCFPLTLKPHQQQRVPFVLEANPGLLLPVTEDTIELPVQLQPIIVDSKSRRLALKSIVSTLKISRTLRSSVRAIHFQKTDLSRMTDQGELTVVIYKSPHDRFVSAEPSNCSIPVEVEFVEGQSSDNAAVFCVSCNDATELSSDVHGTVNWRFSNEAASVYRSISIPVSVEPRQSVVSLSDHVSVDETGGLGAVRLLPSSAFGDIRSAESRSAGVRVESVAGSDSGLFYDLRLVADVDRDFTADKIIIEVCSAANAIATIDLSVERPFYVSN